MKRHRRAYVVGIPLTIVANWPACARPVLRRATEMQSSSSEAGASLPVDPRAWFRKGQAALQAGDLDAAEAAFRKVLAADPQSGSAYADLGVIAMRRKDWDAAIQLLRKAEKLEPKMAGVRLNIGLVEYRRGGFFFGISSFFSLLLGQPCLPQGEIFFLLFPTIF